jgi:cellulose synthase operon protein C
MIFRRFFGLALAAVALARGQEPLNAPVPLLVPEPAMFSPGDKAKQEAAARSAQDLGFDSLAAGFYAELLKDPGADRTSLTLALATVLLDDGQAAKAEAVLLTDTGPRSAAWHLRAALAAGQLKKVGQTRAEFDAIKPDELSKNDRPWFFFLQGMLTTLTDSTPAGIGKANGFYQQALDAATNDVARTRFQLAVEFTRLRLGTASEASIEQTRLNMDRNRGRPLGYESAGILAGYLDMAGRKNRAVEVLQDQLRSIAPAELAWADHLRLLLGFIGGAGEGAGRNALIQLMEKGVDPKRQRTGLHLLGWGSQAEPARGQFRAELDKLIGAPQPHAILDDLLLFRAQVGLATKTAEGYAQADADAAKLRQQFPASPLLAYSYWISAQSAWEQRRYRIAADHAAKSREVLPPGPARADLGVFVAEAWFRAGKLARADGAGGPGGAADFRNAADAYAAALTDPPPGVVAALMFQRVLSEIEAGSLDGAQTLLDTLARDPAFDLRRRWQAEWNLARAFQAAGKTGEAFARVSRLLTDDAETKAAVLTPALRAQMAWLQARLSFDEKPSDATLAFIDKLDRSLEGVDPAMKMEIASSGMVLKAQTNFALNRDAAALEELQLLRKTFPKSSAAILSYMVEADHYAQRDNSVKAQALLTKLAEDFPESEYAPQALFSAALQAERRGQEENYAEAVRRIEDLITLVEKYPPKDPANDLVFTARMKQGDLLRRLNQFSQAQDTYQSLIHNYPQHGDIVYAQLALAECINAQSANDPSHAEKAEALFDQLLARLDAPVDVRVEAGYNLGELFARRGQPAKALEIWWRDVAHTFLNNPATAARLGSTGRYWMARTLRRTGEVFEQQQRPDEARAAWSLIITSNLGFNEMAREKLSPANVAEAAK